MILGYLSGLRVTRENKRKNYPLCLKLVRIIPETWNLVRKYTHLFSFRKYTFVPFSVKALLIFFKVSNFFCKKKSAFFRKNGTFTQSSSMGAVLEILDRVFGTGWRDPVKLDRARKALSLLLRVFWLLLPKFNF